MMQNKNLIILCCLVLGTILVSSAFDFHRPQAGIILFNDDFQGILSDEWDVTAAWYVKKVGDVHTFNALGAGGAWVPTGVSWGNKVYQAKARLDAGSLLFGFNLTKQGRYFVRLDEFGLYLIKEAPAKNYTALVQTGPVSIGEWHELDMRIHDGHIQVYVDQALWIDYHDASPLISGTISVTSQDGSQVAIDDVLVATTGPLPEGVVQAPPPLDVAPEMEVTADHENVSAADQSGGQPQEGSGLPDLVVLEATFDPDPIISGQIFTASFTIRNQGDAASGAFTLLWKFHAATGAGVCSWDYDSLAPGETVWGGCQKLTNAQPGQSPTTLTIDFENEIAESNENNNALTPTLYVVTTTQESPAEAEPSLLPDLTVDDIDTFGGTVNCSISNQGRGGAPAGVRVALFIDGVRFEWKEFENPIGAGESAYMRFDKFINADVEARCLVDGPERIPEMNEDNNELTKMVAP